MKLNRVFFIGALFCTIFTSAMGVVIKKADPVSTTKQASGLSGNSMSSMAGTVLNLVSNVQALSQKQKTLSDECIPSSSDISFVNRIMKEWAKTGAKSAKSMLSSLNRESCTRGMSYSDTVKTLGASGIEDTTICVETYNSSSDKGTVWENYPKASIGTYCSDGELTCSSKYKKTVSDVYDIFALIDFGDKDYSRDDAMTAKKLNDKIENCSNSRLSAKRRAMWGEFLTTTMGGVGQKTNTSDIIQQVSGFTQGGGGLKGLGSLGSFATQLLDK